MKDLDKLIISFVSKRLAVPLHELQDLFSSTIDEILGCLPEKIDKNAYGEDIAIGFHMYKTLFHWHLEEKAGGL